MSDIPKIEEDLADQQKILRGIIARAIKDGKLHHAVSARADLGKVQAELHRRTNARLAEAAETDEERFRLKRQLAEAEGSWVAASRFAQLEREARDRYRASITAADMTPEEWQQRVRADAQAATDEDLEVYVHEWLTRHGYRFVVEGGQLRLAVAS